MYERRTSAQRLQVIVEAIVPETVVWTITAITLMAPAMREDGALGETIHGIIGTGTEIGNEDPDPDRTGITGAVSVAPQTHHAMAATVVAVATVATGVGVAETTRILAVWAAVLLVGGTTTIPTGIGTRDTLARADTGTNQGQ
jgi:hypothetical protein